MSRVRSTSEMEMRPPGARTRFISRYTCGFSGDRLMTQLEITQLATPSPTGRCSISPRRKETLATPSLRAVDRALASISGVMSTPMTWPVLPTCWAAMKQSMPAPLPRSTTTSPGCNAAAMSGLPQPRPRSADWFTSPSLYPKSSHLCLGSPASPGRTLAPPVTVSAYADRTASRTPPSFGPPVEFGLLTRATIFWRTGAGLHSPPAN
mmetsp:Transcript_9723/g.28734  ORF Transcript_9723/g.28734 Transcript_9723/m.28734 type:complete len:208 (-) Transcript_9723:369-992(-)